MMQLKGKPIDFFLCLSDAQSGYGIGIWDEPFKTKHG